MALLRLFLTWLSVFLFLGTAVSSHHHHGHHHSDKLRPGLRKRDDSSQSVPAKSSGSGSKSPEEILARAQAIVAELNKARLENPAFNKVEFLPSEDLAGLGKPAPPIDLDVVPGDVTASELNRREEAGAADPPTSYTLPPEVVEAARIVAESTPQVPTGNHSDVAGSIREKYSHKLADSYRPPKLQRPEGGLSRYGDGIETSSNESSHHVIKRDYGFWMADMAQLGSSPYAPSGYKVWRNVKDFGAVGNGVVDDTAAIQEAIASGNRCGAGCSSSTIVPAVIYFPPGTYLVSSTIIQYYNTQFMGDPHNLPTLLAATSFTGGSVISSNVYISDNAQWYLNTANFMRSIRNFKIDLRIAPSDIYLAGIHWQVAQASSLENIEFYMRYNSDTPGNTQQGIYMENGSGGFLADLTFVGGNFGAYMGNQQFTTSHLVFVNCETAVQVHWDWAWTMHDYIIEGCGSGLVIVGGAGGAKSDTQGVGSLILADSLIANSPNGIVTTLLAENSTSFLLQNVGFFNVQNCITDSKTNTVLVPGSDELVLDGWGFGRINNATGTASSEFINGARIAPMQRNPELLGTAYDHMAPNFFTRRRPKYHSVPQSNIMNVKALGAVGNGVTDDTAVLNAILAGAANTSSIVYFPYGVYAVTDTLRIPIGSRIIGQAWPQIMGRGVKFQNEMAPRPVAQVGRPGDVGIIEIQDMLFTVSGPTKGAVVVEWNAREVSTGSVGLWDTHIRVGGASGSDLQFEQCPKLSGGVNPNCKAASLLMHLKPGSTAYMENSWIWVADHDLERVTKDQIDIYAGRGLLIESDRAWLWGTASEHAVMYQYQLSNASNIFMGMIQTESPYFQPTPRAPQPFQTGLFPNDPVFADCALSGDKCATSWAVRIVDSTTVYILGAGLYSWFYKYNQDCLKTENCQKKGFEVEQSFDVWIYNLCTKAMVEMISPLGSAPTLAADNVNGFLSSILAWLQGANTISGARDFPGFQVYPPDWVRTLEVPETCKTALGQTIVCDGYVRTFMNPGYRGSLNNVTRTNSVCASECGKSLGSWVANVGSACVGFNITQADPVLPGGRMWAGYNETCLVDPENPLVYCNDLIQDSFTPVNSIEAMPLAELCSFCYRERLAMMQRTPYSSYDDHWKRELEYVLSYCGVSGNTDVPLPPYEVIENPYDTCLTDTWFTTPSPMTCDDVALAHTVSSAALFMANQYRVPNCGQDTIIPAGTDLCIPAPCNRTHVIAGQTRNECFQIEANFTNQVSPGDVLRFNPWMGFDCQNINTTTHAYGNVICLGPPFGEFEGGVADNDTTTPRPHDGYTYDLVPPPEGVPVAEGTTTWCGKWHVAAEGDSCVALCLANQMTIEVFLKVNAGLGTSIAACSDHLVIGHAYCVTPRYDWEHPIPDRTSTEELPTSTSTSSTETTNSPTTTTTTPSPSYHAYGCYAGNSTALAGETTSTTNEAMTVALCASTCLSESLPYTLFGLWQGTHCRCGTILTRGSLPIPPGQCNAACADGACGSTSGEVLSLYGAAGEAPAAVAEGQRWSVWGYNRCVGRVIGLSPLGPIVGIEDGAMTVEGCGNFCYSKGWPDFGLWKGDTCHCGYGLRAGAETVADEGCDVPCNGDGSEMCGGEELWSAYMWREL